MDGCARGFGSGWKRALLNAQEVLVERSLAREREEDDWNWGLFAKVRKHYGRCGTQIGMRKNIYVCVFQICRYPCCHRAHQLLGPECKDTCTIRSSYFGSTVSPSKEYFTPSQECFIAKKCLFDKILTSKRPEEPSKGVQISRKLWLNVPCFGSNVTRPPLLPHHNCSGHDKLESTAG